MMRHFSPWLVWALLSATFAALTAILAKVGVERVDSDAATLVRTVVIATILGLLLTASGKWQTLGEVGARGWLFLVLSGLATGASWLCYFRALKVGEVARVAPVDKLSVVMVAVVGTVFLGEQMSTLGWLGIALVAMGAGLVAIS